MYNLLKYCILICFSVVFSCSPKINQYKFLDNKKNVRVGKWVTKSPTNLGEMTEKGRYNLGEKVGKWKVLINGKIFQTEKFRGNISTVKTYHPNGNLMEKGRTRLVTLPPNGMHWFYFGEWGFYDENGNLLYTKIFENGKMTDSISAKK